MVGIAPDLWPIQVPQPQRSRLGQRRWRLACPVNKLGKVTVYQAGRHGSFDGAGAPAFLGAIAPQVVIVNNGPRKGLGQVDDRAKSINPAGTRTAPYERNGYLRIARLPGIEGIWQGHLSLVDKDPSHNTAEDMIANLGETADCRGHWLKASVQPDGRFTVTNGRNGHKLARTLPVSEGVFPPPRTTAVGRVLWTRQMIDGLVHVSRRVQKDPASTRVLGGRWFVVIGSVARRPEPGAQGKSHGPSRQLRGSRCCRSPGGSTRGARVGCGRPGRSRGRGW